MKQVVLALDPSFRNTGYAIFEIVDITERILEVGVIKTEKSDKKRKVRASDQRVEQIQVLVNSLRSIINKYKPKLIVAELPTSGGKSAHAISSMAIAQTVCGAVAAYEDLPYEWVTPTENKKALTGAKNASKEDMMNAALKLYPQLKADYTHTKGQYKGKIRGEFEHIADAIGAFETVKSTSSIIRLLRKDSKA
jgi:Holliday junction resolvasome RuvABC endonuclease subunit